MGLPLRSTSYEVVVQVTWLSLAGLLPRCMDRDVVLASCPVFTLNTDVTQQGEDFTPAGKSLTHPLSNWVGRT